MRSWSNSYRSIRLVWSHAEKPSIHIWLVVLFRALWKRMEFVSWDDDISNIWKNTQCSKPLYKYIYIYIDIWSSKCYHHPNMVPWFQSTNQTSDICSVTEVGVWGDRKNKSLRWMVFVGFWGAPMTSLVGFRENPNLKWMMNWGYPYDLGNLHVGSEIPWTSNDLLVRNERREFSGMIHNHYSFRIIPATPSNPSSNPTFSASKKKTMNPYESSVLLGFPMTVSMPHSQCSAMALPFTRLQDARGRDQVENRLQWLNQGNRDSPRQKPTRRMSIVGT